jgi:5-methylcytosine-specific restriction endonuclease McrA
MAVACTCQQCGETFFVLPSNLKQGSGRYCSNRCSGIARQVQVELECIQCGKMFTRKPSALKNGGGKYCSISCQNNVRKFKVTCTCEQCGTLFKVKPSVIKTGGGRYCSQECFGKSHRGVNNVRWRGGGGGSKYRGENWYQQRKLAYERDLGICQYCGKKPRKGQRKFQVHHIKPFREFNGDYIAANQLTNLITLCHQCHPKAEYGKIAVQPYLI